MRQQTPPLIPLCAEPDRRHEQLFRQTALGPHAAHDAVMKHFIKAWHRGHQGGRDLHQIVGDLVRAFAIPDLCLDLEGKVHAGCMFVGMRERQKRQESLVVDDIAFAEKFDRRGDIRLDRTVGQHDTLRPSACARRVDEAADIIRTLCRDAAVDVGERLGAGNGSAPVVKGRTEALRCGECVIHHDHGVNRRGAVGGQRKAGCQHSAGCDHHSGSRVIHDEMMVILGVGGVGRHDNGADRHDGKIGDRPFWPVFSRYHHPVAGLDTAIHQHGRKAAHIVGDGQPAVTTPLGIDLFEKQFAVATIFDIGKESCRQIGIFDVMRPGRPVVFAHTSHTSAANMPCGSHASGAIAPERFSMLPPATSICLNCNQNRHRCKPPLTRHRVIYCTPRPGSIGMRLSKSSAAISILNRRSAISAVNKRPINFPDRHHVQADMAVKDTRSGRIICISVATLPAPEL